MTIDKNYAKNAITEAVKEARSRGLKEFPTHAYVNAFAEMSSGEEVYFNTISEGMLSVTAWELDLTDFDWGMENLKIIPEATDYTYTKGGDEGATIKCTGALEDFESVLVDGNQVDGANYTLKSGSTILTFTIEYLNTLSVGKHKVTMNYTYGSVDTNLTVNARSSSGGTSTSSTSSAPKPSTPSKPSDSEKPPASADEPSTTVPSGTSDQTAVTAAGAANNSNTSGSITSVQTGDSTTVALWGLSAVLALGTFGVMGWKRYSGRQ